MTVKPFRRWTKSPKELDKKALDIIERGEMVEIPQEKDSPSKFLYKDMGGHLHWVKLEPYEKLSEFNYE